MSEAIDLYSIPHTVSGTVAEKGRIDIQGVGKWFGAHRALDNINLTLPPGSVTVIIGPSGSGKSTLLRTINHLERVDEGTIRIDGDYIGYRREGDTLYELKRTGDSAPAHRRWLCIPELQPVSTPDGTGEHY
ncbi:hypothetical protein OS11_15190 [Dickeya oryzae]